MMTLLRRPAQRVVVVVTLAALAATVAFAAAFDQIHRPMAPHTILDLEFAGRPDRLSVMLADWGEAGLAAARQSLWVDFLFMPAYALLFAGLALLVARSLSGLAQTAGLWLALMPFAAWAWDALENVMLLSALPPGLATTTALQVAAAAAGVKFAILGVTALYAAGGGVWWLIKRGTGRRQMTAGR